MGTSAFQATRTHGGNLLRFRVCLIIVDVIKETRHRNPCYITSTGMTINVVRYTEKMNCGEV